LSEFTVAWAASESPFGTELALQWIESEKEQISAAGWATLASIASLKKNEEIDATLYSQLLYRVSATIHSEKNRVKQAMNNFVISVGGYCSHLSDEAIKIGSTLGKVEVDMGGTACKVPVAVDQIQKMHNRGLLGRKRKSAKC
jgi:hypothetical protein